MTKLAKGHADGKTWQLDAADAGFEARRFLSALVYDNKMWVMGGMDAFSAKKNDVWWSTNGTSWTQATASAPWATRHFASQFRTYV